MNDQDRISRALEGMLSEQELAGLQADVVRDPALRAAYVEAVWLNSALRAQRESLPELLKLPPESKILRLWPAAAWSAAAAACVSLFLGWVTFGRNSHPPVATLIQADNCKWSGSDLPTALNSQLGAGTLALVEGIATLKFTNGATVTIEAPTKLEIINAMHCRLLEGSVVAEVPELAHGFAIDTSDIKVIDLGTRFGLTAGSAGNSQVRVFDGEVEIGGLPGGEKRRLKEGKGLNVNSGNTAMGQETNRGQQIQGPDGWTSIPTSFGLGKDGYARRGDSGGVAGHHPLLMVKHSDLSPSLKNERRAILSFDVSKIRASAIAEAQLVLDPEPSGFGFSALVPDSRFALYAITDEALDQWDEDSLLWNSLPACNEEGPIPDKTRKLAEFWIPRGGSGSPLTVRGDSLAQFIRVDQNGIVSFLIVRETVESDPSGLVHAFASKEHPTARPPTLQVKTLP